MIYIFLIGSLISLAMNLRHAMQMPTESEIAGLVDGDLRYQRSLRSLFGSMFVGLAIMAIAAFFSLTDSSNISPAMAISLLVYYPAYYWVSALGYSELLGHLLKRNFQIDDPLLRPRLFAITRNRAQRVHTIMAVLFSLLLISPTDAAGNWGSAIKVIAIAGWMAWIPVNIAYYNATAKAAKWIYQDRLSASSATVSIVVPGIIFHFALGMFVPLLIMAAPFLLPKILRRDSGIAQLQRVNA